jgi:hypothetical protein
LCIDNTGYPVSLELRKLYEVLPDSKASVLGQLKVVDESGEAYLYPASYFIEFERRPTGIRLPWKRLRSRPVRLFETDAVLKSLRKAAAKAQSA